MDYILFIFGMFLDGIGAYFVIYPIISFMSSYTAKKNVLDEIESIDQMYIKTAIRHKINIFEITNRRIDNYLMIHAISLKIQKEIDQKNSNMAYLGLYYILLGLILIVVSNFIPVN